MGTGLKTVVSRKYKSNKKPEVLRRQISAFIEYLNKRNFFKDAYDIKVLTGLDGEDFIRNQKTVRIEFKSF